MHKESTLVKVMNFSKIIQISQGSSISINNNEQSTNEIQELLFLSILLGNDELYSKLNQKVHKSKADEIQELELLYNISKIFPLISCLSIIDDFASKISSEDEEQLKKLSRSILYAIIRSSQFRFDNSDKLFDIINESFSNYKYENEDNFYDESNHINFFYEAIDFSKMSWKKFTSEFLTKIDYREITGTLWHKICEYLSQTQRNNKEEAIKKNEEVYEFDGNADHRFTGIIYHLNPNKSQNICDQGIISVTSANDSSGSPPKNVFSFDSDAYFFCDTRNNYNSWLKIDFKKYKIRPTHYSVKSRYNSICQNPQNWSIEVSNSGNDNDWKEIDSRRNITTFSEANQSDTYKIKAKLQSNESYRYIRFKQTGPSSQNYNQLAISSLEFFGGLIK